MKNVLDTLKDGGHNVRVSQFVYGFCKFLGLEEDSSGLISRASRYHDIGKIAIPQSILDSVDPLAPQDKIILHRHVAIGLSIMSVFTGKEAEIARAIIATHHEHWNGSGYPQGLCGEAIPIYGRIVALCDVYDELRTVRINKQAWTLEQTLQFIREKRATQFDPSLTDRFLIYAYSMQEMGVTT